MENKDFPFTEAYYNVTSNGVKKLSTFFNENRRRNQILNAKLFTL